MEPLRNSKEEKYKFFFFTVGFFYLLIATIIFCKVYIFHAYPIFYNEDDIPALSDLF